MPVSIAKGGGFVFASIENSSAPMSVVPVNAVRERFSPSKSIEKLLKVFKLLTMPDPFPLTYQALTLVGFICKFPVKTSTNKPVGFGQESPVSDQE